MSPLYEFGLDALCTVFDMKSHIIEPSRSYVNQLTNRMLPWWITFTPHPPSLRSGSFHQSASTLNAAGGAGVVAGTVPLTPAKFLGEFCAVLPSRLSERPSVGSAV